MSRPLILEAFDEKLWLAVVDQVTVGIDGEMVFQFANGKVITAYGLSSSLLAMHGEHFCTIKRKRQIIAQKGCKFDDSLSFNDSSLLVHK